MTDNNNNVEKDITLSESVELKNKVEKDYTNAKNQTINTIDSLVCSLKKSELSFTEKLQETLKKINN